ncbi:MAG TPA: hypothetical protein VNE63_11215 [Candidatus Acidoferrales bacterium]|nr:hypothetical protein [Candidatus Acidoferrales bacterium]
MNRTQRAGLAAAVAIVATSLLWVGGSALNSAMRLGTMSVGPVVVHRAAKFDVSRPLLLLRTSAAAMESLDCQGEACGAVSRYSPVRSFADSPGDSLGRSNVQQQQKPAEVPPPPVITEAGAAVEQTSQGQRPPVPLLESFDGLGAGFKGPQGATGFYRDPSDNSLAVGPDDVVQIVNARLAVYTKKGARFNNTGTVLYGPVPTNTIFAGFGGPCDERDNGDAVVRYDQLAGRWLIVMPIFSPIAPSEYQPRTGPPPTGVPAKPGEASNPGSPAAPPASAARVQGTFAMCYAVSVSSDPLGPYYRYAFERSLFPDYPRPAVWPDGYYIPTSTGDTVIQKHVCIADRNKMLKGLPATEQCMVIDGVNFLNNADVDGQGLPPAGAPNIMMATGGTQLKKIFDDDGIYFWKVHVDWEMSANTEVIGPVKIPVAPYHYLCDGQLSNCVPQPGTDVRLDAQGDKLMQRLVYRRIGNHESIVAAHSIATKAGRGGVRWYEFRLDKNRDPYLYQQGTYAPDAFYRWMPSIAMDKKGDIGVGYSFGGTPNFAGQRFAARLAGDPKGQLTFHETVLADGQAAQTNTVRWEDYTTTAMDPSDDCTFWYVGDYLKTGAPTYSTKIGSFGIPGCAGGH